MRAVAWLRAKRQAQERIERMRALAYGLCVIIPLSPAQAGFALHSRGLQPDGSCGIAD